MIDHSRPTKQSDAGGEEFAHASEVRYRRLFEAAKDGILILEAHTGRIIDANPFLLEMLGFTHEQLIGTPIWELGPFNDIFSNRAKFKQLQEEGYVRYENLPLETKDGRKIAVEFVSNTYQEGDHDVIQCNVRDITERDAAEKERLRVAAIIEYSDEAVVTKTASGTVIEWNRGAERLYGYTAEEMIGHSIGLLFSQDHFEEYLRIMKRVSEGEKIPSFDTVRRRKDGSSISVSVNIIPIETCDGAVVGATKNSHDIIRIKSLEAQVIEAQKMEVLGHLASGVAHDFNNILSVIMGYSQLIEAKLGSGNSVQDYTEEITLATERAAGLTQQLLLFSRKETAQTVIIDLAEEIRDVEKMLRRLINVNIEMTILPDKQSGRIKTNVGYIGQLLMNLVVNARDAMPNGGKIAIKLHSVSFSENHSPECVDADAGDYVMLSVSDTGTGMTDEVKAHLFEAFFTTKPKGKGTGLGLATCHAIVQQSGGLVVVESKVGQGTTFKIYFPRSEQPLDNADKPQPIGPLPCGTETLLIVEDEPAVRHLAADVLEAQGYHVLRASNGQDGLHAARHHQGPPIRLVVTDVVMPLMGGKVMAEWLKISDPGLKILFASGYSEDAIEQDGGPEAGVEFLPKPYKPATLIRKVRAMLDASQ